MRCHERDCAYSPSAHSSSPFALSFPVVAGKSEVRTHRGNGHVRWEIAIRTNSLPKFVNQVRPSKLWIAPAKVVNRWRSREWLCRGGEPCDSRLAVGVWIPTNSHETRSVLPKCSGCRDRRQRRNWWISADTATSGMSFDCSDTSV
jgi:hypothetical protein